LIQELKFWNNICEVTQKPEWKRNNEMELITRIRISERRRSGVFQNQNKERMDDVI